MILPGRTKYPILETRIKLQSGNEWLVDFESRNPDIILKIPEPASVSRTRGFNRPQIDHFYNIQSEHMEKNSLTASTLYNMDETTSNKPPKILSISGKKQVGVISSTERGTLTTVVCCCNAAGYLFRPYLIFRSKRMQERLLDLINGEAFLEWLQIFVIHVRPGPDRKVLLLLDNHESPN
jgi:hypothetical protein